MRVTDIYVNNSITNQGQNVRGQEDAVLSRGGDQQSAKGLSELTPGQVIRGEMVRSEDGQVQIKLANDTLVNARLDQNISLEPGKVMNFQVRSNGQTLMLTPLQANLSMEGPVTRALEMANLPVNSATGELTKLMMQAGLSIDRNQLQQLYREMIHRPAGQISDLVDLHRLGLPVTEDNLNQIGSYKNLTHQLMSGLEETSANLFETLAQLREEEPFVATELFQAVLEVMGEQAEEVQGETAATAQEETGATQQASADEHVSVVVSDPSGNVSESIKTELQNLFQDAISQLERAAGEEKKDSVQQGLPMLSKEEYAQFLENVLRQDGYSPKEKFDFISQALGQAQATQNKELSQALLDSPMVKKLLGEQFDKQWTITPQQVQDPKEVENLYGRLAKQLKGISNALEQAGQTQSPAFQSCTNMNQNLDFLNQINQMYAYVQLPLRLQQGEAHGDLYVYANKKNLAAKDGPITALLHLDMEHLGPLDVYVTMQNNNVGTNFTVADDETLDFLEEHMELLTSRLEKRGYQLSVHASVKSKEKQEETSGIAPILDRARPGFLIQTTKGFDVRT